MDEVIFIRICNITSCQAFIFWKRFTAIAYGGEKHKQEFGITKISKLKYVWLTKLVKPVWNRSNLGRTYSICSLGAISWIEAIHCC
jgi:hypothetical protein